VEVEQGSARRAERGSGGETLEPARDERPGSRVGDQEQHRRAAEPRERGEQDRPAADVVGDSAEQQQAREHADGVRRVDQRHGERREVPDTL
jgi:hypothetical protein